MKDPAFLFYSQDFYTGTATMDFEERGKYITLLCLMHQQGRMDEKTIRFLVGSVSDNLKSKFRIDENGRWYNERLEKESEKRLKFTESRRNNGALGGRPLKNKKPNQNLKDNHMGTHMGNENDNVNENELRKGGVGEKQTITMPFHGEKFAHYWDQWKQYKAKEFGFNYKSEQSEQATLNKLANLAGNEPAAIKIIIQSIENGWKGFFELKTTERNGRNSKISDSFVEQCLSELQS